jgi:hypothetical protein
MRLSSPVRRKVKLGAGLIAQTKSYLVLDLCTKNGIRPGVALRHCRFYSSQNKYLKNKEFREAKILCSEAKILAGSRVGDALAGFSTELSTAFVNRFKPPVWAAL